MAGSNLLQQEKAAGGLLRVSMPPHLHAALEEAFLFERQRMAVPPAAGALLPERQRLRALWAGAVGVSRAYNAVLGSLSSEDRRLCRDRIRCGGWARLAGGWGCQWFGTEAVRHAGATVVCLALAQAAFTSVCPSPGTWTAACCRA